MLVESESVAPRNVESSNLDPSPDGASWEERLRQVLSWAAVVAVICYGTLIFALFLIRVAGPVVLSDQPTDTVSLEEGHHDLEFVVRVPRRLVLLVSKECLELEKVLAINVLNAELGAGFCEVR